MRTNKMLLLNNLLDDDDDGDDLDFGNIRLTFNVVMFFLDPRKK